MDTLLRAARAWLLVRLPQGDGAIAQPRAALHPESLGDREMKSQKYLAP